MENSSPSHPKFSFWVGVCFTLNYVVGSGFLTLPWAFYQTGALLGVLVLAIFSFSSILATWFILESSVRAMRLLECDSDVEMRKVGDRRNYEAINTDTSSEQIDTTDNVILMSDNSIHNSGDGPRNKVDASNSSRNTKSRRIEMTEMCELFLGPNGRRIFSYLIGIYMYGTLWAYCTVFAKAFSVQFALNGEENPEDGLSYYIYLFIFACLVVPLSLMELSEQIYIQVTLTIFRGVMLGVMLFSIGYAYFSCGEEFGSMSNLSCKADYVADAAAEPNTLVAVHFDKLYLFLPIAAYAYIFHHSVPGLSEPVEDKKSLNTLFVVALLIAFVGYAILGVCVSAYFGDKVQSSSNLDWQNFRGTRTMDGSAPWYASIVACFVVLFPALDVASAYPLNSFTLGNNLMSAFYGEDMHLHEKSRFKTSVFRLLAAVPPFLGACVVSELGSITSFTGLTGFAIAFIVPALLAYYSAIRMRELGLPVDTIHSSSLTNKTTQCGMTVAGCLLILVVVISQIVNGTASR